VTGIGEKCAAEKAIQIFRIPNRQRVVDGSIGIFGDYDSGLFIDDKKGLPKCAREKTTSVS
jgi:hypothetical protein